VRRGLGRRALFFAVLGLVCLAMVPAAPPDFRWVAWVTVGIAAGWSLLLGIEDLASPGRAHPRPLGEERDNPFSPPPAPRPKRSVPEGGSPPAV
jgi:hypothetical protein